MQVSVRGKRWRLQFASITENGHIDRHDQPGKRILIRRGMSPELTLETVIHELMHAACWDIDEECVAASAEDQITAVDAALESEYDDATSVTDWQLSRAFDSLLKKLNKTRKAG